MFPNPLNTKPLEISSKLNSLNSQNNTTERAVLTIKPATTLSSRGGLRKEPDACPVGRKGRTHRQVTAPILPKLAGRLPKSSGTGGMEGVQQESEMRDHKKKEDPQPSKIKSRSGQTVNKRTNQQWN